MGGSGVQFVFIVGASGSGTTMLLRILGALPGAIALGGNHIRLPNEDPRAPALVRAFSQANQVTWDRHAPFEIQNEARLRMRHVLEELLSLPGYESVSDVIFKRSAPFFVGDRHRPDLSDLFDVFPKSKVVAIYRDPRASTVSSLRRKFAEHLRQCAVITEEQLTYLSSQLSTLPSSSYQILRYENVCSRTDLRMERLALFLRKPATELMAAAQAEKVQPGRIDSWKEELDSADISFLDRFFDARRCQQWPLLLQ